MGHQKRCARAVVFVGYIVLLGVLSLTVATPAFAQPITPTIPPGWVLADDIVLPNDVVNGDAVYNGPLWSSNTVPYVFNANVTATMQTQAIEAMAEWSAVSGAAFVSRTTEPNYIEFVDSTMNASYVGMIGGAQQVWMYNWNWKYIICHELCHALGFKHEQCRPDRDTYVTINWANISQTACSGGSCNHNFNISPAAIPFGAYDFSSIMHYGSTAFSINGQNTITCTAAYASSQSLLGNLSFMTTNDALGVANRYGIAPVPSISGISQTSSLVGGASFNLTVNGTKFFEGSPNGSGVQGSTVRWGATNLPTTYVSPTQLTAAVSSSLLVSAGTFSIGVNNAYPGGGVSNTVNFTVGQGPTSSIWAWGDNSFGQCNVPSLPAGLTYVAMDAGYAHCIALRSDGSIVAWGRNNAGQCNVPTLPPGTSCVMVAAGYDHCTALLSDGNLIAWGENGLGQCNTPSATPGAPFVTVVGAPSVTLALRSDGTIAVWGYCLPTTVCSVPPLPSGTTYTSVSGGEYHAIAMRSDGVWVAWGGNSYGECNIPVGFTFTAIEAAWNHSIGLRSDGVVMAWGRNDQGQCSVPLLPGGTVYTAIAPGYNHAFAWRSDGSTVAWGANSASQCNIPPVPANNIIAAFAGGAHFSLALVPATAPALQISALATAPVGVPLVYSFSTNPVTPNLVYLSDISFAGNSPGIPMPPPFGAVPLNEPFLNLEYGAYFPGMFSNFIGLLDGAGQATASFNPPFVSALIGVNLYAAGITLDLSTALGIAAVSNGVTTQFVAPAPTVASMAPASGVTGGGTAVTITGTQFLPGATVLIGGAPASNVNVQYPTTITCNTPAGTVGVATVTVANPGTTATALASGFTYYYANPAPSIAGISPSNGPIAGNAPVVISGAGFTSGASVLIGGVAATQVVVVSSSTITCNAPAGMIGAADVVVTNVDTQSATLSGGFTYIPNMALVTCTPLAAAPGATITLGGQGFQAGTQIVAGGVVVMPIMVTPTQVTFPMPTGAACNSLVVMTNPSGQVVSINFNTPPSITASGNTTGPAAGGGTFIISGQNFHPGTSVMIGTNAASIQSMSINNIVAVAPPGTAGPAFIYVTSPSGSCPAAWTTYVYQ